MKSVMQNRIMLLALLVITYVNLQAQTPVASTLQQFASYQQHHFAEKLFAHTDKDFYIAGEIIWFKLYLVDAASHRPSAVSKVAYVEVIGADSMPVLQAKIGMDAGTGAGSFLLPSSLQSGPYILRAYTNWMKNFDATYFFQKPIVIANTLKRPNWKKLEMASAYAIQFFPEGGNLVAGVQSKIGFKAVDQYGKGSACAGVIISGKNDTVARFKTLKFGMGQFTFTPVSETDYTAIIQYENGYRETKQLPQIYKHGVVMALTEEDSAQVLITATVANLPDAALYLLTYKEGEHGHEVLKKFTNRGRAEFRIAKTKLAEGISHLTLLKEDGQPLCERLFFKSPAHKLLLSVTADSTSYGRRKKVALTLKASTLENVGQAANLSMAVVLIDSLQPMDYVPIQTYFSLTSELKGYVESPDYYFNLQNTDVHAATENLLLTQGWRRFRWEAILKDSTRSFVYLPEFEGHLVNGNVATNNANAAPDLMPIFLTMPGAPFHFATTTARNGKFQFAVENAYGGSEIIIQTADSIYRAQVTNSFATQYATIQLPAFSLPQSTEKLLQARSVYMQTQHVFYNPMQNRFLASGRSDTTSFYGTPDKVYALDAYTRFTTMEEVLREYVPEVRVRKSNNQFHYQLKNTPYQTFFDNDPLVLLDGVPVFELNTLMAFDPLKIKTLELVARKYFINHLVAEGIVNFKTYNNDLAGFPLPQNALVLNYEGLQLAREFYTPLYETSLQTESRLPDFRTVLSWMPQINIGNSGTTELAFFTSDVPGTYAVFMQGITAEGLAGSAQYTFRVTK